MKFRDITNIGVFILPRLENDNSISVNSIKFILLDLNCNCRKCCRNKKHECNIIYNILKNKQLLLSL
ncbi:hypothetical protein C4R89_18925 [Clostridioides difficile]|nr:hypothetical protein [Clostridioides difficile]